MKKKIFVLCVIATLIFTSFFGKEWGIKAQSNMLDYCHFGINNPYPFSNDYDMTLLGVDSYINWSVSPDPLEPQNYEHIKVLRVRNDVYNATKANLPAQLSVYPGAIWIIGNEPDTTYGNQDNLLAEVYAQRFLELSEIIRVNDPSALIGFAPIVQPSPVRTYYLELVITEMNKLLLGTGKTISETFDLWTIHSFLLREVNGEWGTGLPPGITLDMLDANHLPLLLDYRTDTHSISLFRELIINFRQWIDDKGLGDKPLWITEYGSLMPNYLVPESETVAYMIETFNFLLSYQDPNIGYAGDENRLVQKWYWYSLNDSISSFGGTLYNRRTSEETSVGRNYRQYNADSTIVDEKAPDFEPISVESISPIRFSEETGKVDYLVIIRVRNHISADHNSDFEINLFDEVDNLLSSGSGTTVRCAGDGLARLIISAIPGTEITNLNIVVSSVDLPDVNFENDSLIIPNETIFDGLPKLIFVPLLSR
ncbi:MAG: hypothetical protein ACYDH1_00900 [Anaerolineaceae bacterium]